MVRSGLVLAFVLPLLAAPLAATAATPVVASKTVVQSASHSSVTDVSTNKKPHKAHKPKKKPVKAS